jgi:hypothetical protein
MKRINWPRRSAPGHHCRNQQIGQTVTLHDGVEQRNEGARRPADLHLRAAQGRDQKAGDDRGKQPGIGFDAAGNAEGHRQRQGHHTDGDAGRQVGQKIGSRVVTQRLDQSRTETEKTRLHSAHPHAGPGAGPGVEQIDAAAVII